MNTSRSTSLFDSSDISSLYISGHIRLADFDLSSPIAPTPLGASLQRRSFVGTPEYVSPEVVDGSGASASVDFWSFGVLLYEMTFGHTPFAGASMQETFANIVSKELKFPSKHSASREVCTSPLRVFASLHLFISAAACRSYPAAARKRSNPPPTRR